MRVIIKRPGEHPEITEIENTADALQAAVGGHAVMVGFDGDTYIACNSDDFHERLLYNDRIDDFTAFVHPALFVGMRCEELCGLDDHTADSIMGVL
jgi:hypothetical protein